MAPVDSQATFHCTANKIDNTGWLKATLHRNNLKTFSDLGFAGAPQAPAGKQNLKCFVHRSMEVRA